MFFNASPLAFGLLFAQQLSAHATEAPRRVRVESAGFLLIRESHSPSAQFTIAGPAGLEAAGWRVGLGWGGSMALPGHPAPGDPTQDFFALVGHRFTHGPWRATAWGGVAYRAANLDTEGRAGLALRLDLLWSDDHGRFVALDIRHAAPTRQLSVDLHTGLPIGGGLKLGPQFAYARSATGETYRAGFLLTGLEVLGHGLSISGGIARTEARRATGYLGLHVKREF